MKNEPKELRALRLSLAERNMDLLKNLNRLKDALESIHACDTPNDARYYFYDSAFLSATSRIFPLIEEFGKELKLYAQLLPDYLNSKNTQSSKS